MTDIEICEFTGEGFKPIVHSKGWRIAVVNSCERLLEKNLYRAEKHPDTDEAFALIKGTATLFVGEDNKRYELEIGKVYNVKLGVWHSLAMGENSSLLIIENDDTSDDLKEFKPLKKE